MSEQPLPEDLDNEASIAADPDTADIEEAVTSPSEEPAPDVVAETPDDSFDDSFDDPVAGDEWDILEDDLEALEQEPPNEAVSTPQSSFGRLLGIAAVAGLLLGVITYIVIVAVSPNTNCVDWGYQPATCDSEFVLGQLAAETTLPEGVELVDVATEFCPDITAEVHTDDSNPDAPTRILCLASTTGATWIGMDTPSPGSCLGTAIIGARSEVSCDSDEAEMVVVSVLPLPEVPDAEGLTQFEAYVDFVTTLSCAEPATPFGPSFFEWRAGAPDALCVTGTDFPG